MPDVTGAPDRSGRVRMVVDGKTVRRVAPHLRKRTYSRGTPYERAVARITIDDDGCWIWQGATVPAGYGHINVGDGRYRHAHIVTWEHHHGPVPAGLELDHLCRVRACVNPEHLEPVTHAENVRRGVAARGAACEHPESEIYYYQGRAHGCRACRRARRPSQKVEGTCKLCGATFHGRSDKVYCGDECRRAARTQRSRRSAGS